MAGKAVGKVGGQGEVIRACGFYRQRAVAEAVAVTVGAGFARPGAVGVGVVVAARERSAQEVLVLGFCGVPAV